MSINLDALIQIFVLQNRMQRKTHLKGSANVLQLPQGFAQLELKDLFVFYIKESWKDLSNDEEDYPEFTPPTPPPRPRRDPQNDPVQPPFSAEYDELIAKSVHSLG